MRAYRVTLLYDDAGSDPVRGAFALRHPARKRVHGVIGIGVLATLVSASCSSYADLLRPPAPERGMSTCFFDVGDTVKRGGVGAAVPEPGSGVAGVADKVNGSASIEIEVSPNGVVTITSSRNGVQSAPTSCILP
jgi:hypothetical protein